MSHPSRCELGSVCRSDMRLHGKIHNQNGRYYHKLLIVTLTIIILPRLLCVSLISWLSVWTNGGCKTIYDLCMQCARPVTSVALLQNLQFTLQYIFHLQHDWQYHRYEERLIVVQIAVLCSLLEIAHCLSVWRTKRALWSCNHHLCILQTTHSMHLSLPIYTCFATKLHSNITLST